MEEGGGHDLFCFGCFFLEEEGEEDLFLFTSWFCSFFVWLVGWLGVFFPGVLLKGANFLVSTFSYHAECGYAFFFFFFFSLSFFFG